MKSSEILQYCLENLEGTVLVKSWGENGIYYNPDGLLTRGVYILTIKEKDGENDSSSNLNRVGIYRVNLGLPKKTFIRIFGSLPKRPKAGKIVDMDYDFTAINQIIPHPVYSWMGWISCINPTTETFDELKPLIDEAYFFSKEKYEKRINKL